MRRERLWTSTIEVEPSNIIHDSLRCLHCEFRVRRANLVDEVWFFDRVRLKNGFRFAIVRNGPGDGYTPIREGESDIVTNSRSTTRSECKMALSTISGPQTKVAPCLSANNRVGTKHQNEAHQYDVGGIRNAHAPDLTIGASMTPSL